MAVQNIMYQGISFLATIRNGFIQLVKVSGTKYDQLAKCKSKGFLLNVLCMEFPLVKRLTMMSVPVELISLRQSEQF